MRIPTGTKSRYSGLINSRYDFSKSTKTGRIADYLMNLFARSSPVKSYKDCYSFSYDITN